MIPAPYTRVGLLGLALVASACAADPARGARGDATPIEATSRIDPTAHPHDQPHAGAFAAPGSRPRLRHTITLGVSVGMGAPRPAQRGAPADEGAPSPSASPPSASPPVTYVYPSFYGYGYGAPGFYGDPGWYGPPGWYGWRDVDVRRQREAKPSPSPSRPPALGEDWAKPPSYGPTFPFKTAPANPWK